MKRKSLAAIWIMIGTMLVVARAAEVPNGPSEPKSDAAAAATASVNSMQCDLTGYKEAPGLKAEVVGNALRVTWQETHGQELRAIFGLLDAVPIIREMAIRRQGSGACSGATSALSFTSPPDGPASLSNNSRRSARDSRIERDQSRSPPKL